MRSVSAVTFFAASALVFAGLLGGTASARIAPPARALTAGHGSQPLVYAVNEFGYSVTAFALSSNGNVAPSSQIAGSQTKIYEPEGLAVDRSGEIAVSDSANDLTLYAPGAIGNVAPSATITCGPGGGPGVPGQIAFDRDGNLYVLYYGGYHAPSDAIEVYSPSGQSGCATSNHILFGAQTGISSLGGFAVDGKTIVTTGGNGIEKFHTSDNGNVPPYAVIGGSKTGLVIPNGLALDKSGNVYVANDNDVLVFARSAKNNATPLAVIGGAATLIPETGYGALSIAVDKDGKIFVGVENASQVSSILVFAPGSNGDVAPVQVISGSATQLDWPAELSIH